MLDDSCVVGPGTVLIELLWPGICGAAAWVGGLQGTSCSGVLRGNILLVLVADFTKLKGFDASGFARLGFICGLETLAGMLLANRPDFCTVGVPIDLLAISISSAGFLAIGAVAGLEDGGLIVKISPSGRICLTLSTTGATSGIFLGCFLLSTTVGDPRFRLCGLNYPFYHFVG